MHAVWAAVLAVLALITGREIWTTDVRAAEDPWQPWATLGDRWLWGLIEIDDHGLTTPRGVRLELAGREREWSLGDVLAVIETVEAL